MILETLVLGPLECNGYVVGCEATRAAMIVDPGDEPEMILAALDDHRLTPVVIVDTHGHGDHIGANAALKQRYPDVPLVIHPDDAAMLPSPKRNLSIFFGASIRSPEADRLVRAGDEVAVGEERFQVLHLPGHTAGGICLYHPEAGVLLSGDTLFAQGIGRTDFPGGDEALLLTGIREKIFSLPDDTRIYPGHGPATTVGFEKANNPFF